MCEGWEKPSPLARAFFRGSLVELITEPAIFGQLLYLTNNRYFIYDSYSVPRYTIGIIYELPTIKQDGGRNERCDTFRFGRRNGEYR